MPDQPSTSQDGNQPADPQTPIWPFPLSVIIPSVTGNLSIDECLATLESQRERETVEVIVVDRCGSAVQQRIEERFPWVRVLSRPPGTPIPLLRRDGIAIAWGERVAVTEDHVVFPDGWCGAAKRGARAPAVAVGGPLVNGCGGRLIDWAAFFCEYHKYLPPVPRGSATDIPGNNVVYTRAALDECRDLLERGAWDSTLHARLLERGHALWMEPDMALVHKKPFGFIEFLTQRFHLGRSFAGLRLAPQERGRRAIFMVGSVLLAPLLLARIVRAVVARRYHVGAFLASLPLLIVFLASWSLGELIGYASGEGASSRKVR